jgi:hypothetical protein
MIEFEKTISQGEHKSGHLNLTEDRGNTHGHEFGLEHLARIQSLAILAK